MTPEEAQKVQDARLAAGWTWCPDDMHDSLEEDMSATIAAMQWEYGVEMDDVTSNPDPSNPGPRRWVQWCASEDYARTAVSAVFRQDRNPRLVRRIVGPVEVVEG